MIQKKKLNQFYIEQYERAGRKKPKKPVKEAGMQARTAKIQKTLRSARPGQINIRTLEELHRQLKNMASYAYRRNKEELLKSLNEEMLPRLMELDLGMLLTEQKEGLNGEFLAWVRRTMPCAICQEPMFTLYPKFRQYKVKNKILELVPARPEMEFAEVRELARHFILHIGPTNSGKTFQALERLRQAKNGTYLGPLRLLALEVYEQMHGAGVPCTMRTGQECIDEENSRVTASTIEMADFDENYDIAVIDEAQLVADTDRGHSWTKAILGLRAEEIHICMSPAAEQVVCHLIQLCDDTFEVRRYERKTELVCEDRPFAFPDDVQEGDALIAFSKKSVLDVAGRLEEAGIASSVIYGSLPPEIRRRQTRMFNEGMTKVAVATDAIGMGLNLGMPNKIPVVEQDFIFSAIAEEMGGIFAVCLILICMSCFIMFINIAMQIKNRFYKYTALGFGTLYGFQVFLTIGGAIRFIPSTGVTLPLVSYGGSSLASSILMFYIIQGMYLLKEDEDLQIEKERAAKARKAKRTKNGQDKK
ncbi:MAG: hypothetical protein EGQ17_07195 [Lachnospiraceae bacterium]|nr:hypothetical protein [Lachnospiraceae bacterium]